MSSSATARTSGFVGMAGMLQPQQQAAEFVEQVGKEILPLLQLSKQYVVREGEWTGRPAEITVFEVAPNTDSGALVPTASQADARQFYSKITTWKGQVTMVRGGALLPMDQQQNEYGPEFTQQTVREAGIAAALSVEMDALLRMREPYTPLLKSVVHGPTSALAPTVATAYRAMQEIGVGMFNGPSGDTELLWRNYVTLNRLVETMRSQARAAGAVVDFIIGAESLSEWLGRSLKFQRQPGSTVQNPDGTIDTPETFVARYAPPAVRVLLQPCWTGRKGDRDILHNMMIHITHIGMFIERPKETYMRVDHWAFTEQEEAHILQGEAAGRAQARIDLLATKKVAHAVQYGPWKTDPAHDDDVYIIFDPRVGRHTEIKAIDMDVAFDAAVVGEDAVLTLGAIGQKQVAPHIDGYVDDARRAATMYHYMLQMWHQVTQPQRLAVLKCAMMLAVLTNRVDTRKKTENGAPFFTRWDSVTAKQMPRGIGVEHTRVPNTPDIIELQNFGRLSDTTVARACGVRDAAATTERSPVPDTGDATAENLDDGEVSTLFGRGSVWKLRDGDTTPVLLVRGVTPFDRLALFEKLPYQN